MKIIALLIALSLTGCLTAAEGFVTGLNAGIGHSNNDQSLKRELKIELDRRDRERERNDCIKALIRRSDWQYYCY